MNRARNRGVIVCVGIIASVGMILLFGCAGSAPAPTGISSPTVAGPSPSPTVPAPSPTPSVQQVEIRLFSFKPETLEVPVGTTVRWVNADATVHTVTSGTPEMPSGLFDSGPLEQGASFSFTFQQPGEYPYFCQRHTHMKGVIRVR